VSGGLGWLTDRRWNRLSLRSRMTVLAATAAAVAVIGVAIASWVLVQAKLYQQFDAQLRSYAQLAAKSGAAAEALNTLRPVDRPPAGVPSERAPEFVVQFVSADGTVTTAGTDGRAAIPVTERTRGLASNQVGAPENLQIGHDAYRVWTVARDGGLVQVARDSEAIDKTLRELGLLHALVGLVGVVGAAALGRTVARAGLRPVDVLTAGAERVAHTQDLTAEIPVDGRGEIARLAEAFNAMLGALATSRAAQRRLVEDAGHELRTPLTSLRNNIELLIHADQHTNSVKVLSDADRARLLSDLGTQTVELSTLISELVDLAKEETSPEPFEPLDLADVVVSAVDRVRARASHVRFETSLAPAEVIGRPVSLERAVLNLLDNAAKWSPQGGTVEVAVGVEADAATPTARITVTDQGPGITETDLPHVFDRFYRADSARALPGSGLGLAIVAQVVAMHGGSVRAGTALLGGALLEISLPLAAVGKLPISHLIRPGS
jgi:two-component system sensor histidine kinase MprB